MTGVQTCALPICYELREDRVRKRIFEMGLKPALHPKSMPTLPQVRFLLAFHLRGSCDIELSASTWEVAHGGTSPARASAPLFFELVSEKTSQLKQLQLHL